MSKGILPSRRFKHTKSILINKMAVKKEKSKDELLLHCDKISTEIEIFSQESIGFPLLFFFLI